MYVARAISYNLGPCLDDFAPPMLGDVNRSGEVSQCSRLPLRVAAAVIIDDGEILACRRKLDKSAGGQWEFPGGKIEVGESPELALIREIGEELNVEIQVLEELTTDTTVVGDLMIELICLVCKLVGSRPTESTDHDQFQWLSPGDLEDLDWAAPDLPAVHILTAGKRSLPF